VAEDAERSHPPDGNRSGETGTHDIQHRETERAFAAIASSLDTGISAGGGLGQRNY
jgi:hypothetical protein